MLARNPTAPLHVYAVWFNMLPGDSRREWKSGVLPDPRVRHFWDERRATGRWFAQHVTRSGGIAWDAYFLYGPEADWDSGAAAPLASGGPVIQKRDALQARLSLQLRPS